MDCRAGEIDEGFDEVEAKLIIVKWCADHRMVGLKIEGSFALLLDQLQEGEKDGVMIACLFFFCGSRFLVAQVKFFDDSAIFGWDGSCLDRLFKAREEGFRLRFFFHWPLNRIGIR